MTISVEQQGIALLQAVCLGLSVGVLYDLFRILRVRLKLPFLGSVLDILFWGIVTLVLFFWSQRAWGGRIRLYGAAFLFVGGAVYFRWLSRPVLKIGYLWADFFALLWRFLTWPLLFLREQYKKVRKKAKKIFHSCVKWYRIYQITGELTAAERRRTARETGGRTHAVQTRRSGHQGSHYGTDGLYGHLSSDSAHADPVGTERERQSRRSGRRAKSG
jgi:hypothetical protein